MFLQKIKMRIINPDNNFDVLVSFIREEIGEFNMEINRETLIEDHLGVTGGEAVALIHNFGKKFNVDLSEFDYSSYFYPEPSFFITFKPILSLTVGDIYDAIETGKLV